MSAPTAIPDLLYERAAVRVDTNMLGRALVFGFSAGDTNRAFEKSIEAARCPPSPFSESSFARDLFIPEFVELCLKFRIGGKSYVPCKPYLRRVLCSPGADLGDARLRQQVFLALEDGGLRSAVERLYLSLVALRDLLSSGDFSSRLDQNQRRLDILRALASVFRDMATSFSGPTALGRLAAYAQQVCRSEGFQFLEELLRYEQARAAVDVRLQMGADGSVRSFEIIKTTEDTQSPLHQSWFFRVWRRVSLWTKGYRVTENEVLSRLIFKSFEGIKDDVPPLFQLIGDLEFYLGGLGFRALCTAAGYPTSFATFTSSSTGDPNSDLRAADNAVRFVALYNPFLVAEGVSVRTCDITTQPHSIVILTGPNSGGKTRLMQSIALCQLLGQGGMPVAAKHAQLHHSRGLFVSMLEEVRADQPEGRLGMELMRIRRLFEQLRPGDVVVLDELCSGTNPSEGEEIFQLVVELIAMLRPQVWLSTHFLQLAHRLYEESLAGQHPYLGFLQVALDAEEHPTYQFKPGVASTSLAGQTAARLGVTRSELLSLVRRSQADATAVAGEAAERASGARPGTPPEGV